jgi:hypothetical protein
MTTNNNKKTIKLEKASDDAGLNGTTYGIINSSDYP